MCPLTWKKYLQSINSHLKKEWTSAFNFVKHESLNRFASHFNWKLLTSGMVLLIAMLKHLKKVSDSIKWKNLLMLGFLLNSCILQSWSIANASGVQSVRLTWRRTGESIFDRVLYKFHFIRLSGRFVSIFELIFTCCFALSTAI